MDGGSDTKSAKKVHNTKAIISHFNDPKKGTENLS